MLVKVYGHVWPAGSAMLDALGAVLAPQADAAEVLELDGDLLRLSFEGIYFPLEEVLEALVPHLGADSRGKIDYLDLDAWTLTRHSIAEGGVACSSASLNNVLDYSGH